MLITFSRPILHGSNRLHTAPLTSPHPTGIAIGTLNIQDGMGFGLAQSIRAVERKGLDLVILTETNIQTELYFHNRLGYEVTCLTAVVSEPADNLFHLLVYY